MAEGRSGHVILLDDRKLEIPIQPKLYAGELLDIVSSHFNLKEKEYFGLAYEDETGHHHWLQLDKKVLEHDFTCGQHKKSANSQNSPVVLYFMVKFYVETIIQLRDNATIELFYLQAKHQVYKGITEIDSAAAFQLAAFVLQANHGDFVDENQSKVHLKKLTVLPTTVLKEHPSLTFCHDEIISRYKQLTGLTRGQSIVNYMSIVETLPTYGVHYFEVKDKGGIPWWLGLSHKGVSQYDHTDKKNPRKVFQWKQLENIYFRDKKFSIEVHDQKRVVHALSSFNLYEDAIEEPVDAVDDLSDAISDPTTQVSVSRRTFGPGNVTVYVWFAQTSALTKCIWSMTISQHQFYLDTRHSRNRLLNSKRSISQIALELTRSCQSLSPASSLSSLSLSSSTQSLCFAKIEEEQQSPEIKAATIEMLTALKSRKEALEDALNKKNEELKVLCLKEGELLGTLPPETPVPPGENAPQVRKRVGTSFAISCNLIDRLKSKDEEVLAKLELEYEIQSKITSAALKLANDTCAKKSVRKARKNSYQMYHSKLKDIEKKLQDMRKAISIVNTMKKSSKQHHSDEEPSEDNCSHSSEGDSAVLEGSSILLTNYKCSPRTVKKKYSNHHRRPNTLSQKRQSPTHSISSSASSSMINIPASTSLSAPPSPCKPRRPTPSPETSEASSPVPHRHYSIGSIGSSGGYRPSAIYQTKTTYRSQHYPTLSSRSHIVSQYDNVDCGSMTNPYKHKFDSVIDGSIDRSGQYSVTTQRASQTFDSHCDFDKLSMEPHKQSTERCMDHPTQFGSSLDRSISCHSQLESFVDIRRKPIESRSLDNLDCDTTDFYEENLPPKICDNSAVYVAGNVSVPEYCVPLTINTKSHSRETQSLVFSNVPKSQPSMQSPRHLPRLRLPMYSEIQHEKNYSPNVLNSPRELNFFKSEIFSPASEPITPVSPNNSDKLKRSPKEWYESNLDSPLPVRRPVNRAVSPPLDLLSTVQQIGDSSPPSPHKTDTTAMYSPPLISPRSPTDSDSKQIISVGHFKPYHEEIKPYETSDFYKYSQKHRKRSGCGSKKNNIDVSCHASPSQVLQQVADDVLTNSVIDGSQFPGHQHFPTLNAMALDNTQNYSSSVNESPYIYESINVQCPNSSDQDSLSPQSRSHYHPLKPMTCEAVSDATPPLPARGVNTSRVGSSHGTPVSPQQPDRSLSSAPSANSSLNMDRKSVADAFHDEMLAWYEGQDNNSSSSKKATLV